MISGSSFDHFRRRAAAAQHHFEVCAGRDATQAGFRENLGETADRRTRISERDRADGEGSCGGRSEGRTPVRIRSGSVSSRVERTDA